MLNACPPKPWRRRALPVLRSGPTCVGGCDLLVDKGGGDRREQGFLSGKDLTKEA